MQSRTVYSSVEALLAFFGVADAGTLYWAHRNSVELPCTSGDGCDLVYASHWSHLGPFPVALIGVAGYIALLFASVIKLTSIPRSATEHVLKVFIFGATLAGAIFSWYLQYVAAVDIGAFCIYCRTSAILITLILLTSVVEIVLKKKQST